MAHAAVTLNAKQVVFNSNTWSSSSGGPLAVQVSENEQVMQDRTGAALLPQYVAVTDRNPEVLVTMRDVNARPTPGDKYNLDVTFTIDGADVAKRFSTMVYAGMAFNVARAQPGEVTLRFVHESADGTTYWITTVS